MLAYQIKIPKDRIAVLIGTKGKTKAEIEERMQASIHVDSKEGDVRVTGEDAVKLYGAQSIIKAIARGFNPKIALRLEKQDWALEIIDLNDWHEKKNHQERMKGRVIGKGGKSREIIEELTGASVSVYGKTVGVLGPVETVGIAKQAVDMLLEGANHSTVFSYLEKKRREAKRAEILGRQNRK